MSRRSRRVNILFFYGSAEPVSVGISMATASLSWLDPTTRQARLMSKQEIQNMPHDVHKLEVRCLRVCMC